MRLRGKVDRNQAEIVRALRQIGCSVQSLADIGNGCPDLLVGLAGRNLIFEVKDGLAVRSAQKLSDDERAWHELWRGDVRIVRSVKEALAECAGGGAPR